MGGAGPLLLLSINDAFSNAGYVVVHSETPGGVTDAGFTPTLTQPAIGFIFGAQVQNGGQDLVLTAQKPSFVSLLSNPASGTTDPNVSRVGADIDRIEQAISVTNSSNYLINLLRLQSTSQALGNAVTTLTPSNAPHLFEMTYQRTGNFLDSTTDCPFTMPNAFIRDNRNCLWASGSFGDDRRGKVEDSPVNKDDSNSFTIGGQASLDDRWKIGFGFSKSDLNSSENRSGILSTTQGEIYQLALSANYREGGWGLGFVSAGSVGDWKSSRNVNINGYSQDFTSFDGVTQVNGVDTPIFSPKETAFNGISGQARSDANIKFLAQRIRFSYLNQIGSIQAMPFVDVDGFLSYSKQRTEAGAGLANLTYPAIANATVSFTPGIEFGLVSKLDETFSIRAYVRGGVSVSPQNTWIAETQFLAAPSGLPAIQIQEQFDRVIGKVDAGINLFSFDNGTQLQVDYGGAFGQTMTEHTIKGGLTFRF